MYMSLKQRSARMAVCGAVLCATVAAGMSISPLARADSQPATTVVAPASVIGHSALSLTPASGYANTVVTINGSGFRPNLTAFVFWKNIPVATVHVAADGTFSCQYAVPGTGGAGYQKITAYDAVGDQASATFLLL